MTQSVQATAEMHIKLGGSLERALDAIYGGDPIPWGDLEAGMEVAVKNGIATAEDLDQIKDKNLPLDRLRELLEKIKDGYGATPNPPPKI